MSAATLQLKRLLLPMSLAIYILVSCGTITEPDDSVDYGLLTKPTFNLEVQQKGELIQLVF
jgi:hypothetical protein